MSSARSLPPYVLFFLSGASGLIYQVVWVRQFGNVFGNTIHSAALITAVFMSGLGVGSYLAGVWADARAARGPQLLLAAYGWSEILIGSLGVALALILPRLVALSTIISSYSRDGRGWYELSGASIGARYVVATVLLAPMTLLMGGTLTLLVRYLVAGELSRAGLRIGALYGFNTAGAALGCFLTDFTLVPSLGLLRTQYASASVNVAVGVVAVVLASRLVPAETVAISEVDTSVASSTGSRHAVALTALAIALTGFAGMGLEIVWFRFLSGTLGQFRAVFSLLLTVILVGIWVGSLLGGWAERRFGRPALTYLFVEVLFVLVTLALLARFDREEVDGFLVQAFRNAGSPESGLSAGAQVWAMLRAIALVVGPPSVLMGSSFPLANAAIQRVAARVGRRAGALYLANTLGSVAGSLLAGFVLLPRLGAQQSVLVLAAVAGVAILPLYLSTRGSYSAASPVGFGEYVFAGGTLSLVIALSLWGMGLPSQHLLVKSLQKPHGGEHYLDAAEGPNETLAVSVEPDGDRRLWTNGHSMSTTSLGAQRYMRSFSHIPLLSIQNPRDVLVICFGVGNTIHAASLHPSVVRLDLADLSRNVLDHASWFATTNGRVLDDPRVRVYVNDGRQHLRMVEPGTYDLVTLEPPPINHAGVAALYSREFYELARSRLKPGGFLTQWLPVDQLAAPEVFSLVRAFLDVFPASALLSGDHRDLVLLGVNSDTLTLDPAAMARRLVDRPAVADDLSHVDLARSSDLIGTFAASSATMRRVTASAAPVTDDAPTIEYSIISKFISTRIPRELFDTRDVDILCPTCAADPALGDLKPHLRVTGHLYADDAFLFHRSFSTSSIETSLAPLLEGDDGSIAGAIQRSGYLQDLVGIDAHGLPSTLRRAPLSALEAFVVAHPEHAVAGTRLGQAQLAQGHLAESEATLRRAAEAAPTFAPPRFGLAYALGGLGRHTDAIVELRRALQLAPRDIPARVKLVQLLALTHQDAAIPAELARLLEIDPDCGPAHHMQCLQLLGEGKPAEARSECSRAYEGGVALDPRLQEHLGLLRGRQF